MAALSFFGYFFLGLGPGIVFFCFFIVPKSFLVLLTLFSAFLWLTILLITSAIFRGFEPIEVTSGSYAGLLVASVFIQEAVRYGVWRLHRKTETALDQMAVAAGHRFALIDRLYIALAWGFGHGACHVVFFYLSLLPLTTGDGTYYPPMCPDMSLFLSGALYSLGFGMILTSLMVVAFDGYHTGNPLLIAYAPLMHLTAALITLAALREAGCMVVAPVLLALGVANVALAAHLCWSKGMKAGRPAALQGPPPS